MTLRLSAFIGPSSFPPRVTGSKRIRRRSDVMVRDRKSPGGYDPGLPVPAGFRWFLYAAATRLSRFRIAPSILLPGGVSSRHLGSYPPREARRDATQPARVSP